MSLKSTNGGGDDKKGLTTQVISGFKWSYLSAVVHALSHLVVISALAHLLSKKDFGLVGIALIFTSLAERVGQIGIGPSIVQRHELSDLHIRAGSTLAVLTGFLIFAFLFAVAPSASVFFSEPDLVPVLRVVSAVFIFEGFGMVSESLLQRRLRFKDLAIVENAAYLLGTGAVGVSLATLGYGVWSLVIGMLFQRFVKTSLLLWYVPPRFVFKLPRIETRELINTGFGFSLGRLLNYTALQGDNCVVGRVLGVEQVGIYGRAYQLMTLPATYIGQVLDRVLFPAMARKQNDLVRLKRVFLYGVELVAFVTMPASVYMYLAAPEIVRVLFGSKWDEVIPVFGILALGVFFRTGYKSSDTLVRAMGAVYRHASRQAIYSLFVVGGSLIGSWWGLEGVAVAVLGAVAVNYLVMSSLSLSLLKMNVRSFIVPHYPALWVSVHLYIGLSVALYYLRSTESSALVTLVISIMAACFITLGASLVAPRPFRLTMTAWLLENVKLEKYGRVGRITNYVLLRMG